MAESAALLVDEVLPHEPIRQWVLSFPFQLRFLLASRPAITGQVPGIVYRVISMHLVMKEGYSKKGSLHWSGNVDSQMTALGTLLTVSDNRLMAGLSI